MQQMIGREKEIARLDRVMEEVETQLVIVCGRRRVGKTFLINAYFENRYDFKFTGSFNRSKQEQCADKEETGYFRNYVGGFIMEQAGRGGESRRTD